MLHARPILSALIRNRLGAVLIALQIAVTLAVVCNAVFVIEQRIALTERPTGMDEATLLTIQNSWLGSDSHDEAVRAQADIAALRALPDVVDAFVASSYPLSGNGFSTDVDLKPDQASTTATAFKMFGDDHALPTLGLRLLEGRNFMPDEIGIVGESDQLAPDVVIITRALGHTLFADESALGKTIYLDHHPTRVIGIVERMQTPYAAASWARKYAEGTVLEPYRLGTLDNNLLIRTKPGMIDRVAQAARTALLERDRNRVLEAAKPFSEIRAKAYRDDRGLAIILIVVCLILLGVTALGIVGLTSFWVTQRRRQIGIRRALGATRRGIVHYFQTENLMIAVAGAAIGGALAFGLNVLMVKNFEMAALPAAPIVIGALLTLALGQLAVLWPALRAASIPPALATRSG